MPHGWSANGIDGLCEMFPSLRADLCLIALTDTRASADRHSASRHILPLWHGARHACSLIKSVRIAERLAKEVALFRRDGASRDLHDSAVQAYIGLKLGLEAMRRRFRKIELASDLDELIKIASDGIGELRSDNDRRAAYQCPARR
jgi:signal transduction histidine kinase